MHRPNENRDGSLITNGDCRTCRNYDHAPCYIGREFRMFAACRKAIRYFPDGELCPHYEREPGSDDE